MTQPNSDAVNPELDLVFERIVDVPPELVWACWTTPTHITKWFTPAPWKTVDCEIDLRPGGKFYTLMRSPEGQEFPNIGCYLEVVAPHKLVWTGALDPGYRPRDTSAFPFVFTAILNFEPHGSGTKYTARVLHSDIAGREKHEAMGFHAGWGLALDQLVDVAKKL